ncbi:nucleoside hydrolase [Rhizobium sp. KVB221]|uniref:Nucleoside hydrolase n=1 Tax=Rhizobium setariae TaxID=2801340 RepID=A0A936YPA0_9HYPH|nr:nucleoside hydrolase [Rhizobium setariae]MBL0374279.1 nucleoside hydrolase [Rhizobium setariae]
MAPQQIIIDCDPGIDDAIAILLALASPHEIEVRAIHTVVGNRSVDKAELNARRILSLVGRGDIAVHRGCERYLMQAAPQHQSSHGSDGLGEVELDDPDFTARPQHAVDALISQINATPGEVTVCAIGPLTNIALALVKEPEIAAKIQRIVFMGGAAFGPGNMTSQAEFNIWCDPYAARIVLSFGIPTTMFGLDVTNKCRIIHGLIDELAALKAPAARKAAEMLRHYSLSDTALHDACVIAYLIDQTLFSGVDAYLTVDTTDGPCFGRTVADVTEWDLKGHTPNCLVMTEVDDIRVLALIRSRLAGVFCG